MNTDKKMWKHDTYSLGVKITEEAIEDYQRRCKKHKKGIKDRIVEFVMRLCNFK